MNHRKPISLLKSHLSRSERERLRYAEELIVSTGEDLDTVKASMFVNATARREYDRALRRLREAGSLVGNLSRSDLISYANAYGRYMDLVKILRDPGHIMVVETRSGPKANPIDRMINEAAREMASAASRLGMSLSSQLAAMKENAPGKAIDTQFGEI